MNAGTSEGAAEGSSLVPLVEAISLALVLATIVLRVFTSGGGIELLQPGVQVLADALALVAAACLIASRGLARSAGEPVEVFRVSGVAPWVLAGWAAWLALGAASASHAELAWRSALTFTALPLLALTARELCAGRPARARLLLGALLAALASGALLAIHQAWVEIPATIAAYAAKDPELMRQIEVQDPSLRIALIERLHSRGATGPFLLPGLLATICLTGTPLLGLACGGALRRRERGRALLAGIGLLILVLGVLVSRSKGAVVSAACMGLVGVLLAPVLGRHRRPLAILSAAGLALLFALGVVALWLGPERAGIGLSLTVRLEYWEAAVAMWRDAPLRGLGLNQFREYYSAYKATQAEEAIHAHNAFLQLLAETGIGGLALFLGAVLSVLWRPLGLALGRDTPRASCEDDTGQRADGVAGGLGLLVGWLLLGVHGDTYHSATLVEWLVIAAGLGLGTVVGFHVLRGLPPRWLAAAALVGATAWFGDGLLNFGVHHAGTSLVVWLLLGLGGAGALSEGPTRGGALLGAGVAGLALWVVVALVPGHLAGEGERALARAYHFEAAQKGERAALERASEHFARACEATARDARTWLEYGAVLARLAEEAPAPERHALAEEAVRATQASLRIAPRQAASHYQLGRIQAAREGSLPEAQAAFDRAVELYPAHPEHLLEAAAVRVRRLELEADPALFDEAEALFARAEAVSAATRLKRIQLRPEQEARIARLRARLEAERARRGKRATGPRPGG